MSEMLETVDILLRQLKDAAYRLNVLEPGLMACRARAEYNEQQLAELVIELE